MCQAARSHGHSSRCQFRGRASTYRIGCRVASRLAGGLNWQAKPESASSATGVLKWPDCLARPGETPARYSGARIEPCSHRGPQSRLERPPVRNSRPAVYLPRSCRNPSSQSAQYALFRVDRPAGRSFRFAGGTWAGNRAGKVGVGARHQRSPLGAGRTRIRRPENGRVYGKGDGDTKLIGMCAGVSYAGL